MTTATDNSMPMPDWADEKTRNAAMKALATCEMPEDFSQADLVPVTIFSSLFAEWMFKDKDLLLHVFPRAGEKDQWYPESYSAGNYIPGRREEKSLVSFPDNISDLLKESADKTWMGSVAIEHIEELGAYSLQFQGAKNTVNTVGADKFVDKFCEELDRLLG